MLVINNQSACSAGVAFVSFKLQRTSLPDLSASSTHLPIHVVLLSLHKLLEALHLDTMAETEAEAASSAEDGLPTQWKLSGRRSRKSGCSNIFTGVNMHQLHRLFRTAGDRNAEHRAKLVWRGVDADKDGAENEREEEEEEERGDEAGLAQALVGLRVRARNKAGIRLEGHREHKWLRASGYLRVEEPLSGYTVEEAEEAAEADLEPNPDTFLMATEDDFPESQNPFKPSSWRLGVTRLEGARDPERYLHGVVH